MILTFMNTTEIYQFHRRSNILLVKMMELIFTEITPMAGQSGGNTCHFQLVRLGDKEDLEY